VVRAIVVAAERNYMPRESRNYRLRGVPSRSDFANTINQMPLYEFRCRKCDSRFEALVEAGTETEACRECGAEGAERVMSPPAEPPRLVRGPGGNRRQEERNRKLREKTRSDFTKRRRRAQDAARSKGGGS
jgi:putative FmdB family regulatory protein